MLALQKILVDVSFVKSIGRYWLYKRVLVDDDLQKAYKGQRLQYKQKGIKLV